MVRTLRADARAVGNMRLRRLLEGDRDDPLALGQLLAGPQVERHAGPAPVVDADLERDEGLGVGVAGDALLAAVAACTVRGPRCRVSIGSIERKTLFFSSLIARGSRAVGGSIATNASTWNRWVTTMSL